MLLMMDDILVDLPIFTQHISFRPHMIEIVDTSILRLLFITLLIKTSEVTFKVIFLALHLAPILFEYLSLLSQRVQFLGVNEWWCDLSLLHLIVVDGWIRAKIVRLDRVFASLHSLICYRLCRWFQCSSLVDEFLAVDWILRMLELFRL